MNSSVISVMAAISRTEIMVQEAFNISCIGCQRAGKQMTDGNVQVR